MNQSRKSPLRNTPSPDPRMTPPADGTPSVNATKIQEYSEKIMRLYIEGPVNKYYIQTLCMIFFPGSTFGQNEQLTDGVPEIKVSVYPDENGTQIAYASIKLNDRVCEATETVSLEQEIAFATHECIAVGRAMFAAGKEMLGHIPPWGILTGIRPAKVAGALLTSGRGILKTKKILRDEYVIEVFVNGGESIYSALL